MQSRVSYELAGFQSCPQTPKNVKMEKYKELQNYMKNKLDMQVNKKKQKQLEEANQQIE